MSIGGRSTRQHWIWWAVLGCAAIVLIVTSAGSPPTEGVSQDRVFAIASQLKCVQCVGESAASSSAPIAVEFRQEILEQMGKGQTNDEILNYFAARYDDVLLRPPSAGVGALVWVIPVVAVFAALLMLGVVFRNWSMERIDRVVTDADQELVDTAMNSRSDGPSHRGAGDKRVVDREVGSHQQGANSQEVGSDRDP